ncbi:MAG TPA: histidinol dehydrogenase [Burkholderiaceae bacterium]|nr:histidinol dehydrogenase [Burkholderiaceae bacterium]
MIAIRRLDTRAADFERVFAQLNAIEAATDPAIEQAVEAILSDVRARGDAALVEYTARFDHLRVSKVAELEITAEQMRAALDALPDEQKSALVAAAERIRAFHQRQFDLLRAGDWIDTEPDGTRTGQRIVALDRVGLYVPGGKAAYPSSVLMNALPARVAGVRDLVLVVPTPNGERNPLVLAAASLGGVTRAYALGGAQAIGALAYGTETIAPVDKIVGPGNAYVASAKRRVFGTVGIDMIAGPTEIWVIADESADPDWVAMDLFSQAEHDELAQAILLTPDATLADAVSASIDRLLPAQPRREIIAASFARRGAVITTRDLREAAELVNRAAPEHMEIVTRDAEKVLPLIRHAGAIFVGHYSSEALGDYCAGPNHVLPTVRTARFASPLGVYDFVKRSNVIDISAAGARRLAPIAATLARGERLEAHARSAELRAQGDERDG